MLTTERKTAVKKAVRKVSWATVDQLLVSLPVSRSNTKQILPIKLLLFILEATEAEGMR